MPSEAVDYLPLSYLSQADYCLRRAALLMNEQVWLENADTAKGRNEHQRVHTQRVERRGSSIKLYEYPVFSEALGVSGLCDCVEAEEDAHGCRLPTIPFPVRLYPIEYKHGVVRQEQEYDIQLCAQAICLEEMYHTAIPEGAIFYITAHRRQTVIFTPELRALVRETAEKLRQIHTDLQIPPAHASAKCRRCSLRDYCLPKLPRSAAAYCKQFASEAQGDVAL